MQRFSDGFPTYIAKRSASLSGSSETRWLMLSSGYNWRLYGHVPLT